MSVLRRAVCVCQVCVCCQCMPQPWLQSVWSLNCIQNETGEFNHFAAGETERERERREGERGRLKVKKDGVERETWDNWTELPFKTLAAGFMSSACGAYLRYVLSSWPYIESGTITQTWYKYWVETFWQQKLWPRCWNYEQHWRLFLRGRRENKTNEVTVIFL